ncbi:VWA domain-containing protein [Candidatus Woesearchaeota archaeon]|nr:VWA domain-containing protein [Candidatus Woesearchaeota archaeon]
MNRQTIIWTGLIAIAFAALVTIAFPKTIYEESSDASAKHCECFGSPFWYGTKCVGIPYNCSAKAIEQSVATCDEPTCDEIAQRLRDATDGAQSSVIDNIGLGTDVILVMDASNSMEGEKLLAAKRAAQRLVDNLQLGERIGVITFSETSAITHNFSDDKRSLTEGIMAVTTSGGTNYLPALEEARTMFRKQERRARKGIIFLSDGVPSDEPGDIINVSRDLREQGISIFTINFGIDGDEENILEEMVKEESDASAVQRWYRAFTNTQTITQAFSEAWDEITTIGAITIIPTHEASAFDVRGLDAIGLWAKLESLLLTGMEQDERSLCVPQLEPVMTFTDQDNRTYNLSLVATNHQYRLSRGVLPPGNYSVRAKAFFNANNNGSCSFTGTASMGNITVTNASSSCGVVACALLEERLEDFDLALREEVLLARERGPGRVAILMDTSESIRPYLRQVSRAVDRLNRLLSLRDRRALVTFADEAHLVVPLTRDKDAVSSALGKVSPQGTTRLIPALRKTRFLFSESAGNDIAVVFTDGMAYDEQGYTGVQQEAELLVSEGTCLYFFTYGTGILEQRAAVHVLKSLAARSQQQLRCGGYTYDPNSEELSLLVTEMFGGEKKKNQSLGVFVEVQQYPIFSHRRNRVVARVMSARTGLRLPVSSSSSCIPDPVVSMTLEDGRGKEVAPLHAVSRPDGAFEAALPHLLPGRYRVVVEASVPPEECGLSVTASHGFVAFGSIENTGELIIMLGIIVLAGLLVFGVRQVRRSS